MVPFFNSGSRTSFVEAAGNVDAFEPHHFGPLGDVGRLRHLMSDDSVGENVPHEQGRVTRLDGLHSHVHAAQTPALFEVT